MIDCPNRQGGPLTQSALTASNPVVYVVSPTSDAVDGYYEAQTAVQKLRRNREAFGAPLDLREVGIVVDRYRDTVMPRAETASVDELRYTGQMISPLVPSRTMVQEAVQPVAGMGTIARVNPYSKPRKTSPGWY